MYHFKKLFSGVESTDKPSAKVFIKEVKKHLPKELTTDEMEHQIPTQLQTLTLARKVEGFELKKTQIEVLLTEAHSIVGQEGATPLPFKVSDELQTALKGELAEFAKIESDSNALLYADPRLKADQFSPLLESLSKLKIRSKLQSNLQDIVDDQTFFIDLWQKIEALETRINKADANDLDMEAEAFEYKQLKRAS